MFSCILPNDPEGLITVTNLFYCLAVFQVLVEQEQPARTVVCSLSFTSVNDTPAAPGSILAAHGAQLLQIMMLINCGDTVKDVEVRNKL